MLVKRVAVCFAIGLVAVASAGDINVGYDTGKVVFEQNVTASPTIWRQDRNLTVNVTDSETITRIVVTDNRPDKDGEAKIVEGGEGYQNVTIQLKSPAVFRGFDFTVKVYADEAHLEGQSPIPNNPKSTGLDTQNPQVPYIKDVDVNNKSNHGQQTTNDTDIILGAPVTAVSSTTEAQTKGHVNTQVKIAEPTVTGQEQTRQNRDTQNQKASVEIPTPAAEPSKDDEPKTLDATQTAVKLDDDVKKVVDEIFAGNFTQQSTTSTSTSSSVPDYDDFKIDSAAPVHDEQTDITAKNASEKKAESTPKPNEVSSTTVAAEVAPAQVTDVNLQHHHNLYTKDHLGSKHKVPLPYATKQ